MNDDLENTLPLLPLDLEREIDVRCRDFERACKDGQQPHIEDYLAKVPDNARLFAIRELVAQEVELRWAAGEAVDDQQYHKRFPQDAEAVNAAFALLDRREQRQSQLADTPFSEVTDGQAGKPSPAEVAVPIPERIGRFEIQRLLGEGGFGAVYLARDTQLKRLVALKVPRREHFSSEYDLNQFIEEARTAAQLDHPGIVTVYDVGQDGEQIFIVQEYIEGQDLAGFLKSHSQSTGQIAELMIAVADAVAFAHQKGFVHRDLKPGNILLDSDTKPRVADFGLAVHESIQRRRRGERSGTPAYMSPEQVRGETHRLDGRSDIWSLGVILYEMLIGKPPFHGETRSELYDEIKNREPKPPRQIKPELPAELERICLMCLSKRITDRYSNAADLAEHLRHWLHEPQQETMTEETAAKRTKIVPKGLRSFDAADADFFLDLLPGPRDRDGLPASIRFWKTRIEETDADKTFRVGLLYGPSGCGKSSFVKAGLLPQLNRVVPIYVEATSVDTEIRILVQLRKIAPSLSRHLSLPDAIANMRENPELTGHSKTLLVVDQFEQWLQSRRSFGGEQLIEALRQCDGIRIQVLILVRDDFWMAITRFLHDLEVDLVQGENLAPIDLFDPDHARKVLTKFGRAYGKIEQEKEPSCDQLDFISDVVDGISSEGRIVCVRLAVFAEMVKGKQWIPDTIEQVGGTTGIGESFLEDAFAGPSANPQHRAFERQARAVLKTLLPDKGSDIKGHMIARATLQKKSECGEDPVAFEQVIRILDTELRLITPTDPDSQRLEQRESVGDADSSHYQLTHDYLVPSLRNWLTRKQRSTAKGRAELRLEERADVWSVQPENRYLPSFGEFGSILLHTPRDAWTNPQKAMIHRAGRVYGFRTAVVTLLLAVLGMLGFVGRSAINERDNTVRSEEMVQSVLASSMLELPEQIRKLEPYRQWCDPLLQAAFHETVDDSPEKLRAGLALVEVDETKVDYLFRRLQSASAQDLTVILTLVHSEQERMTEQSWELLNSGATDRTPLPLAAVVATYDPDDERWTDLSQHVVRSLVKAPLDELGAWRSLFSPMRRKLMDQLDEEFSRHETGDHIRNVALAFLVDYIEDSDQLAKLIARVDPEHFSQCVPAIKRHGEPGLKALRSVFDTITLRRVPDAPELDPRVAEQLRQAEGLINGNAAIVQMLPLDEFSDLNDALMSRQYHTVSFRPLVVKGKSYAAACWHRGQRRSAIEMALSAEDLQARNANARDAGMRISDISYLDPTTTSDAPRLAAVWIEAADDDSETQVYANVSSQTHRTRSDELSEQGLSLFRLSTCTGPDGLPLFTAVWRKMSDRIDDGSAISRIRYASRFGDVYPGYLQTDLQVTRIDFSQVDLFDQFINSKFLSHQVAMRDDPKDTSKNSPSKNVRFRVAQYELLFRRYKESIAIIKDLLQSDDNTTAQLANFHQYLGRAYFRLGNLPKLKESFEMFSQNSRDSTKTLTLQLRIGVLEADTIAVEKSINELSAICEKNNTNRIAQLIAVRGHAIAAKLPVADTSKYRQNALEWLRRLVEGSPRDSDLEKLLSDEDFDSLRVESAFSEVFKHRGFGPRLTAAWSEYSRRRSSALVQLGSDDHLRRAEELAVAGYIPVALAGSATQEEAKPSFSSVWHIDVDSPREQTDREVAIANLAAALAHCADTRAATAVLSDTFGRSARAQAISRLSSTETPADFLLDCVADSETVRLRRVALLTLGKYTPTFFENRFDRLTHAVSRIAEESEDNGERAAAAWCLRAWGLDSKKPRDASLQKSGGFVNTVGQLMIRIEPSKFLMGSPVWEPYRGEEETQHWRAIPRSYALAATETTVAQFREFLDDPKVKEHYQNRIDFTYTKLYAPLPNCPQVSVRWFDAALFCQWLSEKEGIPSDQWCFPGIWTTQETDLKLPDDFLIRTGYRLPTEAEWEYACRAGSQSQYPFGWSQQLLSEHGWNLLNSLPPDYATRPVGMTPPNDFGFFDMIGNVNEWCVSSKGVYTSPFNGYIQEDKTRPEDLTPLTSGRVVRGGSFDSVPRELRCADRKKAEANYKRFSLGFRLARTVPD